MEKYSYTHLFGGPKVWIIFIYRSISKNTKKTKRKKNIIIKPIQSLLNSKSKMNIVRYTFVLRWLTLNFHNFIRLNTFILVYPKALDMVLIINFYYHLNYF